MASRTKATCSTTTLTASFGAANPPLIWRFDLERNHSFTLALQGESGDWELGVTSPKGDFYPVVHFDSQEDAEEAFARIERALSRRRTSFGLVARTMVGFIVCVFALMGGIAAFGYYVNHKGESTPITSATVTAPVIQEGVPLSADDVLKAPQ